MKDYTATSPSFSDTISVIETTDKAHADNVNAATKQLLENTLALLNLFNELGLSIVDGEVCQTYGEEDDS